MPCTPFGPKARRGETACGVGRCNEAHSRSANLCKNYPSTALSLRSHRPDALWEGESTFSIIDVKYKLPPIKTRNRHGG